MLRDALCHLDPVAALPSSVATGYPNSKSCIDSEMNTGNPAMRPSLRSQVRRIVRTADGATAVEYGLIAALIAVTIVGALVGTEVNLGAVYQMSMGTIGNAMN